MSASVSQPQQSLRTSLGASVTELLTGLSNFWFGMSMLGVWGIMTLIGVVVDQGKDTDFYLRNYSPPLARLVLRLHLDNIYHSAAYLAIVGFILACMTLATFWRVIPTRLPPLRGVKIDMMPPCASASSISSPITAGSCVSANSAASSGRLPTSTTGRARACSSRTSDS
jgi:hypothetical protein